MDDRLGGLDEEGAVMMHVGEVVASVCRHVQVELTGGPGSRAVTEL